MKGTDSLLRVVTKLYKSLTLVTKEVCLFQVEIFQLHDKKASPTDFYEKLVTKSGEVLSDRIGTYLHRLQHKEEQSIINIMIF